MRRTTDLMRTWKAEAKSGEGLYFELCKGGYFSNKDEYGLRLVGKTAQNTLEGTNLCLNFSDRTERDFGAFANTTKRNLDGRSIYKGCTGSNHSYANNIENYILTENTISYSSKQTGYNVGFDIKIETSTTYSLSALNSEFGWSVAEYTEDGTYIGCIVSGYLDSVVTFTTSETAYYVLIVLYPKTTNTVYSCTSPYLNKDSNKGYETYCGGMPSPNPDYPQSIQCVKMGTKVTCGDCEITTPCNLYEDDIWYPMSGKVVKNNGVIESYSNEEIITDFFSTTGELTLGAKIIYRLTEPIIKSYNPQVIFAPKGTVDILQTPIELTGELTAAVLKMRT